MLAADENTRCVRAKILDKSKFWGSKCHKFCTSNTLRVELMTHFSQRGEAAKASVCSSLLPTPQGLLHPVVIIGP